MTMRRLPHVVVTVTTLLAPLAALAQATNGSVTTAPLATAPVMGLRVLALLAMVLALAAAYLLRRTAGRAIAVLGFVAALTALTGLGYANPASIMVVGGQCGMQTTQMFDSDHPNTLVSNCQNSIQIVSLQSSCAFGDRTRPLGECSLDLGPCRVGQVLAYGDSCTLPTCVC